MENAPNRTQERQIALPQIMITVEEMCDLMSIGRTVGYRLVRTPGFPSIKIGHKVLIPYNQLLKWTDCNVGNTIDP